MNFSGPAVVTTTESDGHATPGHSMTERSANESGELQLHLLVLRCQAGDERAFAQLLARFEKQTLGYVRGITGDAFSADDVQQEVWLAVYLGIGSLANPRAFRTWLFQTTRHRAIDFMRRRKREAELFDEESIDVVERGVGPAGSTGPPGESAADSPLESFDTEALAAGMAALAPAQREVLLLRYEQDLSYAEIALVTGSSVGTVRSRLFYGKERLQEAMKQFTRGLDS
jgi:RNA polymerase sigma-70 factor (ECF subfamily)